MRTSCAIRSHFPHLLVKNALKPLLISGVAVLFHRIFVVDLMPSRMQYVLLACSLARLLVPSSTLIVVRGLLSLTTLG